MDNGDRHPLRKWRARHGVSLREFSKLLEREAGPVLSYASLARIESGTQPPSSAVMRGIFQVTKGEITPNILLGVGPERSSACAVSTPNAHGSSSAAEGRAVCGHPAE